MQPERQKAATWLGKLNVRTNLTKAAYTTYRPDPVARTISTPAFSICCDENKANYSYDWAHEFVASSMSASGYGFGQELPYAGKSYLGVAGEPDKAKREELAAKFFDTNRKFANGNQGAMNNYKSIKLAP